MKVRSTLDVLKRARRPSLVLRLVYCGLIAWTMIYVSFDRSIQKRFGQVTLDTLGTGPLATVIETFSAGHALRAVGLIFAINLIEGTLFAITVPSRIVPFSGLLGFGVQTLLWGALFAPQIHGAAGVRELLAGLGVLGLILLEARAISWGIGCLHSGAGALEAERRGGQRVGAGVRVRH